MGIRRYDASKKASQYRGGGCAARYAHNHATRPLAGTFRNICPSRLLPSTARFWSVKEWAFVSSALALREELARHFTHVGASWRGGPLVTLLALPTPARRRRPFPRLALLVQVRTILPLFTSACLERNAVAPF